MKVTALLESALILAACANAKPGDVLYQDADMTVVEMPPRPTSLPLLGSDVEAADLCQYDIWHAKDCDTDPSYELSWVRSSQCYTPVVVGSQALVIYPESRDYCNHDNTARGYDGFPDWKFGRCIPRYLKYTVKFDGPVCIKYTLNFIGIMVN